MKKSMLSTKQSYLMCAVGIVVLFGILMGVCGSGMASTYIKGIMMTSCIAIIMTTSLNLTIGVLGQLTLGCCGFEAIGAYSAALLSKLLVANGVAMDPTAWSPASSASWSAFRHCVCMAITSPSSRWASAKSSA